MPGILDQLKDAGKAFGDSAIASGENLFGDLSQEEYEQRTSNNRTIMDELFKSDEKIYSPDTGSDFRGNQLYNEYTMDQLAEIREGLKDPEGTGTYYEIDFPQGFTKRGATGKDIDERQPWIEASGGEIKVNEKLNDFAYFERLVQGNKYLNTKKAFGKNAVPKGHDTEFYELALDGGFSEVYFKEDPIVASKIQATSDAVAELDNEQLDFAQASMNVFEDSKAKIVELDTFEPEEGTATQAPVQKHFKTYSLKEQEEAATKLETIDESTTGGSFSPKGAGSYESILKDPAMKQLALDTYKDLEGEDISEMKDRDQTAVLKTFASEQSNNITKMLSNMVNLDTRKARRLSAFLKAYRSSDLSVEQFAEGVVTTVTDPMTYITGGTGALLAKPIIKEGMKKALVAGTSDAMLTGLAQSIAEQSREKTAGNIEEISGKEVLKHMGIAALFGAGASFAMQKLSGKKVKDMTSTEKELLTEEIVKYDSEDVAPKGMEGMFKGAVEAAAKEEAPDQMEGMFARASKKGKEVEDTKPIEKDVITELEEDKVHPELRQKISAKEKEKEKEEPTQQEDNIKYRNKVKNLVTQRLLPESVEGAKRDVPITSKGVGDIFEYQTQGRLSGQALSEKANRAAEMLSIEEGSTKKFTKEILDAQKTTQQVPKKGEHPLKRDLDTTNLLIDSLNGRRFVLEDSGKPLKGKELAAHQEAIFDLKTKRDELKTKMQDTDVEVVARRKYGEQFTEDKTVEPFDFENLKTSEKDELLTSRLKDMEKEHDWKLETKRLSGKISDAKNKEVDSFLTNLEDELSTKIQETRKEKGDISVSTTALSKKEKSLLNKIATVKQDRIAGMPDDLYKAEIADIFLKNEGLGYTKKLTEEKFTAKKARTQKLMEQLDIILQDATIVKPKEELKKVSYKDRKVIAEKQKPQTAKQKLNKEAKANGWIEKDITPSQEDKIFDNMLNREGFTGAEEKSWSKIFKEAIDEKVITRREAKQIFRPKRIVDGKDRGIFDYNEFRAEKVARVAEKLNEARAERDLGLDLGVVETGKTVSQNEAIDSKFSNIQIASAMTGDDSGFKAIGAVEGFDVDLRGKVAHDALREIGISERAIRKIENKVDKIAKIALGNKAYTEGKISVVRKLSKFFDDNNIKVSTEKLMDLYDAINRHAEQNQMGVLANYAKQMQEAVAQGRIEPTLKFKNFDGTMENIKVHEDVTTKQKFLGQEAEILALPTTKDTRSGKVAALITQSIDAYIERAVRKAIGYKGTASVFDAFITGTKKDLPKIEKAVLQALKTINEKGGLPYILRQIDPKGVYKDIDSIDFTKIKSSKLLDTELEVGRTQDFIKGIDTAESFLMSNTGMAINSLLKGTITNKRGLDALRESVTNASRIVEHTPEQLRVFKELGYTDEQIGKRSDLEYSELDKLAGEVSKASTESELAVIAQKYVPKGKTVKQKRNWSDAMNDIVKAQRKFMERKANYKGKRIYVSRNGEDIGSDKKSLVEFFNEISTIDKETLSAELNTIDKAKEFVRRAKKMPRNSPERKAVEAKNIIEAEPHLIKAKPENKEDILVAHATKAKEAKGKIDTPQGLHDRYTKNKKMKEDKQCAN